MDRDLFLAILAMDSYNRGYDAGVAGLPETGEIGNATIRPFQDGEQNSWQSAGFYAVAYDVSNVAGFSSDDMVISYRGTGHVFGKQEFST